MIRLMKFAAIIGVLAMGLVFVADPCGCLCGFSWSTVADSVPVLPHHLGAASPASGWAGLGSTSADGVQQQDKLWTFLSSSLPGDTYTKFLLNDTIPGIDQHRLIVGDGGIASGPGTGTGTTTVTLAYTIQVTTPNVFLDEVAAGRDSNSLGSPVTDLVTLTDNFGNHYYPVSNGAMWTSHLTWSL